MGITKSAQYEMAIDPAALVLRGKALQIYYEKKHPRTPLTAEIAAEILKAAPAADRKVSIAQAKKLMEVCQIIIEAEKA